MGLAVPLPALIAKNGRYGDILEIVNAYTSGPDQGWKLVLVHPDGSQTLQDCYYDYFVGTESVCGPAYTRIKCRTWKDRDSRVRAETRPTFESDLSPVRRFLADNPDVIVAKPRRAMLDLEVDPTPGFERKAEMRILVACAVGDDGKEFTGVLEDWSDEAEKKLLQNLFEFLKNYDQVAAWNGGASFGDDGFDFPVLRARVAKYWPDYVRKLNRWLWIDHLKGYRKLHLMFAETGEERASYSLDNVAKFVLGEGKIEYDARQTLVDWQAGGIKRDKLVQYCQQDTHLLPRIEAKTGVLDLAYQVAALCGVLHDTSGLHATTFVDGFLLRLAGQRGMRLPTKPYETYGSKKKNFAGAFVFETNARGIEKDVMSYDFGSLYPNVAIMLNASPETKGKPGSVSPLTGVTFSQESPGIVPHALLELGKLKKQWKKTYTGHPKGSTEYLDSKRVHDAVKSVVNSVYGYLGSKFSRMYDKDIAESITLTGQFLIKSVAKQVEERGWTIVQGDTDSSYVKGATKEELRAFLDYCNTQLLPSIARAHRCEGPPPPLEFDSHYERLVVVGKKKYFGRYAGSSEYDTKGLEWRRGDSSPIARQLQEAVCRKLMDDRSEDPEDFPFIIETYRNRVLHDDLPLAEVVLSESLGKELHEYEGTSPAVSVAKILRQRGAEVGQGTKIKYVVTDGSVSPIVAIPAADYTGEFDRYYTWENLVYPPTQRVLEAAFPDSDWTKYAKVRPPPVKMSKEARYQERWEKKGQLRLPFG